MVKPKMSESLKQAWKRQGYTVSSVMRMRRAVLDLGHSGQDYKYRADVPYDEQIARIKSDIAVLRKVKKQPGWSEKEIAQFDVDISNAQGSLKHIQMLQKTAKTKKARKKNGR